MDVSVIIPTYNNCSRLNLTLTAFTGLDFHPDISWELIVVDNNSNDSTKKTIESYSGVLPIKYVSESNQGISNAKNAGLKKASGQLVIFTDDDVRPCKDWILVYWREYKLNPVGYFWGGPVVSEFEAPPIDWALIQLAPPSVKGLHWGNYKRKLTPREFFIGANWAVPLRIVKGIGGFNIKMGLNPLSGKVLVGEESDLMNRLQTIGLRPLYLPGASIKHFVPKMKMTLDHIASRTEASGRFLADKALNTPSVCFQGVPRWIYKQAFVFLLKSKIKRILLMHWHLDYLSYRRLVGCIKQIKNL